MNYPIVKSLKPDITGQQVEQQINADIGGSILTLTWQRILARVQSFADLDDCEEVAGFAADDIGIKFLIREKPTPPQH